MVALGPSPRWHARVNASMPLQPFRGQGLAGCLSQQRLERRRPSGHQQHWARSLPLWPAMTSTSTSRRPPKVLGPSRATFVQPSGEGTDVACLQPRKHAHVHKNRDSPHLHRPPVRQPQLGRTDEEQCRSAGDARCHPRAGGGGLVRVSTELA
jgi:hypothetical protein